MPKKIRVNDDFFLVPDSYNWTVEHWRSGESKREPGKKTRRAIYKHYSTLEQACMYILNETPKKEDTISDVIFAISESKREIVAAIGELKE